MAIPFHCQSGSRSGEWAAAGRGDKPCHIYSRNTNPTVDDFEARMHYLEDAEDATSFAAFRHRREQGRNGNGCRAISHPGAST